MWSCIMNWMEADGIIGPIKMSGTAWPDSREAIYAEDKMKTLFQAQEALVSEASHTAQKAVQEPESPF
jgi:hypothetical protein